MVLAMPTLLNTNPVRPNRMLRIPPSKACLEEAFLKPEEPAAEWSPLRAIVAAPPELSVEQLVEQCQAGSMEAFALLVERYEKRVFHFLWQMAGNPTDAEDLAQETFLKAYKSIQRFKPGAGFSTWLFTIA